MNLRVLGRGRVSENKGFYESEEMLARRGVLISGIDNHKGTHEDNASPKILVLQWHITDRCNLSCSHCYRTHPPARDLPMNVLGGIFENYITALKRMKTGGHINITGGEPFLRDDLFPLLERIRDTGEICSFGILSNGSLLRKQDCVRLKSLGCRFFQVSLDGGRRVHDSIRGAGSYDSVIAALKMLRNAGINTLVSFTAGRNNFRDFPGAMKGAKKGGADIIWADRVIPAGTASCRAEDLMTPGEAEEFFVIMNDCRKKLQKNFFSRTRVTMDRALQFLVYDGDGFSEYSYRCSAGDTHLTVMGDGSLVPCRRMPVIIGDLKKDDLYELYCSSALLSRLRNYKIIPQGCGECLYSGTCNGGLKCLSYSLAGSPFMRDPHCSEELLGRRFKG